MSDCGLMKRERFLSLLRKALKRDGRLPVIRLEGGKGGHAKVFLDGRQTIVKSGDLSPVYIEVVLKQLGLPKDYL